MVTVFAIGYVVGLPAQLALTRDPRLALSDFFLPFLALAVLAAWGIRRLLHLPLLYHMLAVAAVTGMGVVVHFYRYGDMPTSIIVSKGIGILVVIGTAILLAAAGARNPKRLVWWAIGSTAAVTFMAIVDYLLAYAAGIVTPYNYWVNAAGNLYRLTGSFQDPNAFGGLLVTLLCLNLCLTTAPPRPDRLFRDVRPFLRGVATVIFLVGIGLTFSRTAWIGAVVGVSCAIALRPRQAGTHVGIAVASILPGGALLLLNDRFRNLASFLTDRPKPVEARLDQFADGLAWVRERPIFGSGLGSYLRENEQLIHNTLFAALVELGIIGLAVFLWFFASCLWVSFRASRDLRGTGAELGAATTAALAGLIGVSLGVEVLLQRYLWFTISLVILCAIMRQAAAKEADAGTPPRSPPVQAERGPGVSGPSP